MPTMVRDIDRFATVLVRITCVCCGLKFTRDIDSDAQSSYCEDCVDCSLMPDKCPNDLNRL
jgi:hypothetical protein